MPRVISGASAGSIITALIGFGNLSSFLPLTLPIPSATVVAHRTRTDDEIKEQIIGSGLTLPKGIRLDFFRYSTELKSEFGWSFYFSHFDLMKVIFAPQLVASSTLFRLVCGSSLVRCLPCCLTRKSSIWTRSTSRRSSSFLALFNSYFIVLTSTKVMKFNVGEQTFQEAFDRTGRIINITVAPLNNYGERLLSSVVKETKYATFRPAAIAKLPHSTACLYLECSNRFMCHSR